MDVSSGSILRSPGLRLSDQFYPDLSTHQRQHRSQLRICRVATCAAFPDVAHTATVSFTFLGTPRTISPLSRSSRKLPGPCTTFVSLKTVDAPLEQYSDASAPPHTCLVQAFSWTSARAGPSWYEHLEEKVADLAAMGFTDVLLPPCTASADPQGTKVASHYHRSKRMWLRVPNSDVAHVAMSSPSHHCTCSLPQSGAAGEEQRNRMHLATIQFPEVDNV